MAHTPQQNGVAEQKNQMIVEMARSMLNGMELSNSLWAEAANTVVYILNRSATKAVDIITPQKAYSGKNPSIAHFIVFGCKLYMHVSNEDRTKLELKSKKCIFLGYNMESKAYRLYDPKARKVELSEDMVFQEEPRRMEDERPSPSSSEITCTHDNKPTEAEESAPSPQRRGKKANCPQEVDSEEEDEEAAPQGDRPFPKWYTQLLDGADAPSTSNEKVPPRRSRRLEEQRRARLLADAEEEPTVRRSKRIEEQ